MILRRCGGGRALVSLVARPRLVHAADVCTAAPCVPASSHLKLRQDMQRSAAHVAVGISGGVDSAVAALLLQRQGYRVSGVHMTNWDHEEEAFGEASACEGQKDAHDAAEVCRALNIPFHRVHFDKVYWTDVFEKFLEGLGDGVTPNPDVLCNRRIKFDVFTRYCREELGADAVATGHYARLDEGDDEHLHGAPPRLLKGSDGDKDQSYFLCRVPAQAFSKVLFPLGDTCKSEVRALAAKFGLENAHRKSSTGICFVGKRRFADFLGQYLQLDKGEFVDADGNCLGIHHSGQALFTVGQRARISGMKTPMFVCGKEASANKVSIVAGRDHAALYCRDMIVRDMSWLVHEPPQLVHGEALQCHVAVRYRSRSVLCTVKSMPTNGVYFVRFEQEVPRAVTAGQVAAFYQGDLCLGGSIIDAPGESFYHSQEPLPPKHMLIG